MAPEKAPRRLGRGLDALLGQNTQNTAKAPSASTPQPVAEESALQEILVTAIQPNHYQPRKVFNQEELSELRESLRATGLLQPITVRKISGSSGYYELIAGERRLRAAQQLEWVTIPAIVRDYDDKTTLTLALVENLQREDLNPIEEAEGYARLANEFNLSQNEIADLVGKNRSTVANFLRILNLPIEVRNLISKGDLTLGHARPLLALEDEDDIINLATEIVEQNLSVRTVEDRIRQTPQKPEQAPKRGRPTKPDTRPSEVRHVEDLLRKRLQTDVSVAIKSGQKGEVKIQFYSYDDLNRILELLDALE